MKTVLVFALLLLLGYALGYDSYSSGNSQYSEDDVCHDISHGGYKFTPPCCDASGIFYQQITAYLQYNVADFLSQWFPDDAERLVIDAYLSRWNITGYNIWNPWPQPLPPGCNMEAGECDYYVYPYRVNPKYKYRVTVIDNRLNYPVSYDRKATVTNGFFNLTATLITSLRPGLTLGGVYGSDLNSTTGTTNFPQGCFLAIGGYNLHAYDMINQPYSIDRLRFYSVIPNCADAFGQSAIVMPVISDLLPEGDNVGVVRGALGLGSPTSPPPMQSNVVTLTWPADLDQLEPKACVQCTNIGYSPNAPYQATTGGGGYGGGGLGYRRDAKARSATEKITSAEYDQPTMKPPKITRSL